MKTTLTVQQSAALIKRGVSIDKASMVCMDFNGTYAYVCGEEAQTVRDCVNGQFYVEESRVFSLLDLLSLLPKHIRIEHRHYYIRMSTFVLIDEENPMWIARYITNTAITLHERRSEELIDALYKLIISLLDDHVKLD